MKNIKFKITDILSIILGNFILSFAVAVFILPLDILSGGVPGIAVSLQPLLNIDEVVLINIITYGLFIVGAIFLGKDFAIKTMLSTILYPLLIQITQSYIVPYVNVGTNQVLGSIYAGVFLGIGVGLIMRVGASSGGMDIPPLIMNKYLKIPLADAVLIVDGLTVLLGASVYGIEAAMIGLFSVATGTFFINKVLELGSAQAKQFLIISDKWEEILEAVHQKLQKGATILDGEGGYHRVKRNVLMVVIYQKQFATLKRIIDEIDPSAFVIVSDVHEVHGEGFTYLQNL